MSGLDMEVHPVADLFPMLADDELKDLAADIAERGLLQPIVLDAEGRILDGRNRYAACGIAGVSPDFVTYDGDDADGYALAVNINRRHLNKGQQAMITVKAARVLWQNALGEKDTDRHLALESGVSTSRISYANVVLTHAPDLADGVVTGAVSLDAAYETARQRKTDAESTEARMAELRAEAPDLAEQVTEESLTLAEALAALRAREAQRESERRAAATNLRSVLTYLTSAVLKPEELADDYDAVLDEFDPSELDFAAQTMAVIARRGADNGQE